MFQDGFQRLSVALRTNFAQCNNVTLERPPFQYQAHGENAYNFVPAFGWLATTCEFRDIIDSILGDEYFEGIASRRLRSRLYGKHSH